MSRSTKKIEWLREKFEKKSWSIHSVFDVSDMLYLSVAHARGILNRLVREGWIVRCDYNGKEESNEIEFSGHDNFRRNKSKVA